MKFTQPHFSAKESGHTWADEQRRNAQSQVYTLVEQKPTSTETKKRSVVSEFAKLFITEKPTLSVLLIVFLKFAKKKMLSQQEEANTLFELHGKLSKLTC